MNPGFEDIFGKQRRRMLSFIEDRIGNRSDAEDLLQEVYYGTLEHLNALRPIDNLTGWLWRSIRNRVIDYYRRRKTRNRYEAASEAAENNRELIDLIGDSRILEAGDRYFQSLVLDSLYEAIEELPQSQREVILLQGVEGRSFREIAEMTGVSVNTLTARKRYALRFLRKRLQEIEEYIEDLK